jgi:hypothetical protein
MNNSIPDTVSAYMHLQGQIQDDSVVIEYVAANFVCRPQNQRPHHGLAAGVPHVDQTWPMAVWFMFE